MRKQNIANIRNNRQEQIKKARAEADAKQQALASAADKNHETVLAARAKGYDKLAAKLK